MIAGRPPCPELAVCICEFPSLSQQEPYSVPLSGKKGVEPMLWIDVAATQTRGQFCPHPLWLVYWTGAPNRLYVSVCPLL